MMYNNKLVCSIKSSNGKVLREKYNGDSESLVYVPFGTEYKIYLKNLSSNRALVHIDIDGDCVTDGGLIVDVNRGVDLERAIKGNLNDGRKFKFIKKTEKISDFRGDKAEDGLVFVRWQFENPPKPIVRTNWPNTWTQTTWGGPVIGSSSSARNLNVNDVSYTKSADHNVTLTASNIASASVYSCHVNNDVPLGHADGITVEGSKSDQAFNYGYIGDLQPYLYSLVFRLVGSKDLVTVKTKLQCHTCGDTWPSRFEFCGSCGTALRK